MTQKFFHLYFTQQEGNKLIGKKVQKIVNNIQIEGTVRYVTEARQLSRSKNQRRFLLLVKWDDREKLQSYTKAQFETKIG